MLLRCSSTGSSTSVSPVSNSSGDYGQHRRSLDLNARPRPFVARRSSVTLVNEEQPKVRQASFEIRQQPPDTVHQPRVHLFRAVPLQVPQPRVSAIFC